MRYHKVRRQYHHPILTPPLNATNIIFIAQEAWKPDDGPDDFYGPDDTEWINQEKENKAKAKKERATHKTRTRKVEDLAADVVSWKQPDNLDTTLLSDIDAAHKQEREPTYTVVNPASDPNKPETQRTIFKNLMKQFDMEVQRAKECGSWFKLAPEEAAEVWVIAKRREEMEGDDIDTALNEPDVRRLVKMLIERRRDACVV